MLAILGIGMFILILGSWYEGKGALLSPFAYSFIVVSLFLLVLWSIFIVVAG